MKSTLTLKNMSEIYKNAKDIEYKSSYFIVPKKLKRKFDKVWKSLPWHTKLFININRKIHGLGLYPYEKH